MTDIEKRICEYLTDVAESKTSETNGFLLSAVFGSLIDGKKEK